MVNMRSQWSQIQLMCGLVDLDMAKVWSPRFGDGKCVVSVVSETVNVWSRRFGHG